MVTGFELEWGRHQPSDRKHCFLLYISEDFYSMLALPRSLVYQQGRDVVYGSFSDNYQGAAGPQRN